jgi:biopolymer transport protein ExbB/TolQ
MHRESGLAHRHYVLKPWQVRAARILLSRPMLLLYVSAIVTWGWMASQALRVPLLQQRIGVLTRDAQRLDTLTQRLAAMEERYNQVQRMLGAAEAASSTDSARSAAASTRPAPSTTPAGAARDTARRPAVPDAP